MKLLFLFRSETLLWCIFKAQNAPFLDVGGVLIFLCYLLGATATEAVMMIFFSLREETSNPSSWPIRFA